MNIQKRKVFDWTNHGRTFCMPQIGGFCTKWQCLKLPHILHGSFIQGAVFINMFFSFKFELLSLYFIGCWLLTMNTFIASVLKCTRQEQLRTTVLSNATIRPPSAGSPPSGRWMSSYRWNILKYGVKTLINYWNPLEGKWKRKWHNFLHVSSACNKLCPHIKMTIR